MVILHVKRGDESQFLYQTEVSMYVSEVVSDVVAIFNGRLKVTRLCYEIEDLGKHGTFLPPEIIGLTDEQVMELKLEDQWATRCAPVGYITSKDPVGRRCGRAPPENLKEVLDKAIEVARNIISNKQVESGICLTQKNITQALEELKGATMIVFPSGLPPHDPVRQELENVEDLTGLQASKEVIDPARACIWYCGKKFIGGNKLKDHLGPNDKSKVVVKICSSGESAPGREPIMSEEQRKALMLQAYRRQEELKKLEQDDDDTYLDSRWADAGNMKREFHGMKHISWKPNFKK